MGNPRIYHTHSGGFCALCQYWTGKRKSLGPQTNQAEIADESELAVCSEERKKPNVFYPYGGCTLYQKWDAI